MKLYSELAEWFHLLTAPEDYAEEAATYRRIIEQSARRPVREVLELGSGGGNNASHMKAWWDLTLSDLSPQMVALSQGLHPELPHHVGDMRSLRLGRRFDAVFVHDACSYLRAREDLAAVAETCRAHLRPGGVALLCPDYTAETWQGSTSSGGHDGPERGLRYLEWSFDPHPDDGLVTAHMVYLLREGAQVRVVDESHVVNAFPQAWWLGALEGAGFDARAVPFTHSEVEHEVFHFVGICPD